MANVLMKRIFNRNLIKFKDCTDLRSQCICTNVIFIETPRNRVFQTSFNQEYLLKCRIFPSTNALDNCRFLHNTSVKYNDVKDGKEKENSKIMSLFKKFKQMYKQYWYVFVPVHLVTSAFWFGGFYYLAKSGVDIQALLRSLHLNETIINSITNSHMGYLTVALALYKIATPARYAVTFGGATVAINYLKKWGYIKPIPSTERLKEIYHAKKDNLIHGIKKASDHVKKS